MQYYTYILWSSKLGRYYIGYSTDVGSRLEAHNSGKSKFTQKGKPWTLMYTEAFSTKKEAMSRERYLKRMKSRSYIEKLITEQ